ncbi:MAG: polyprenyl synthetase family protein [Chloroflexota bacterium]|nr:polyprenyl synthetase family protein [Chloroflexota bacterium]
MAVDPLRKYLAVAIHDLLANETSEFPAAIPLHSALVGPGKILVDGHGFTWGMLPVAVARAVEAAPSIVLPLSISAECLMAALDVLDDMEDGDATGALWRSHGLATAANVSTLLLFLAQTALGQLAGSVEDGCVVAVHALLARAGVAACIGQQEDLDFMQRDDFGEEAYLRMVGRKAGALVQYICQAAALVADGSERQVTALAALGHNLGMAMQIANDVAGASVESERRGDLWTGKRTLPVLFALDAASPEVAGELRRVLGRGRQGRLSSSDVAWLQTAVEVTGGLEYAMTVADCFRERALAQLTDFSFGAVQDLVHLVNGVGDAEPAKG